jgi:hypothetical protein
MNMIRFLIELWPAVIPLLLYTVWIVLLRRRAHKSGIEKPGWLSGPWFWMVLATAGTLVICLFAIGVFSSGTKGDYIPPHMENGTLVPGRVDR